MDFLRSGMKILTDPKHTRWIAPCLILAETVLCGLIIWKVPYTEIDYTTYMQQVHEFLNGERDYSKIEGPTGPIVYPALHVYIYSLLYQLTVSNVSHPLNLVQQDFAVDIGFAQLWFACLYVLTLAVVIACYRRVNAPAWLLVPLVLSKRLHSIFLLRLFNDSWATFFLWLAIFSFQRKRWAAGTMLWSLGVGVKMTIALAAPAVALVLIEGAGLGAAVSLGAAAVAIQTAIGLPFLGQAPRAYILRAFDLSRQFMHKWTVNWRFVDEATFLSTEFKVSLLVLHVSILLAFIHTKWSRASSTGLGDFPTRCLTKPPGNEEQKRISARISPVFVMDAVLGSMAIGLLCARSLHYQFYAYLGWATPYLLWRGLGSPVAVFAICAMQEVAWLTFPSTNSSSYLVVISLALQVMLGLIAPPVDHISPPLKAAKPRT